MDVCMKHNFNNFSFKLFCFSYAYFANLFLGFFVGPNHLEIAYTIFLKW